MVVVVARSLTFGNQYVQLLNKADEKEVQVLVGGDVGTAAVELVRGLRVLAWRRAAVCVRARWAWLRSRC